MKLFIKRNVQTENRAFTVFDESGNEKYYARFIKNKLSVCIQITDARLVQVAKIHRFPVMGTTTFLIKTPEKHLTLTVVFGKGEMNCYFHGSNRLIRGNPVNKDFYIIDVDNTVISSHKNHSDYRELDIFIEEEEISSLAVSICIDLINTVDNPVFQVVQ